MYIVPNYVCANKSLHCYILFSSISWHLNIYMNRLHKSREDNFTQSFNSQMEDSKSSSLRIKVQQHLSHTSWPSTIFSTLKNIYAKKCADECNFLGKITREINERLTASFFIRISSLGIFQLLSQNQGAQLFWASVCASEWLFKLNCLNLLGIGSQWCFKKNRKTWEV